MPTARIALVTGANRGIGLEVCRQLAGDGFTVVLGSRDAAKGKQAAVPLVAEGLAIIPHALDVTNDASIEGARAFIDRDYGRLDVLVNNAAILYDSWQHASSTDMQVVREAFETNTIGAWRMAQAFLPLLRRGTSPRIVNVSSEAGSLTTMGDSSPAYSVSKAALNAVTRMLADELKRDRILVNAVCPGWVATDMGGTGGRPIPEGAASVLWAVRLPDDGPTGGFFRDGRPLPW